MSEAEQALAEIEKHRAQIDALDQQIVALLNERAGHSLDIRVLKPAANMNLFDPAREDEIVNRLCSYNKGPMQDENLKEIYQTLLKVMKEVPSRK